MILVALCLVASVISSACAVNLTAVVRAATPQRQFYVIDIRGTDLNDNDISGAFKGLPVVGKFKVTL